MRCIPVLIVNYKSHEILCKCLSSITEDFICIKFYILNNDPSIDLTKIINETNSISIYQFGINLGFARGINFLVSKINSFDFFLILNPDAILSKDAVYRLFLNLTTKENLAVISPLIAYPNGIEWFKRGMINWEQAKIENVDTECNATSKLYTADIFNGCCALFRKQPFEKAGKLTESLFMYYDEAFLSMKLKAIGYEIAFTNEVRVVHNVSFSSRNNEHLKIFFMTRNGLVFFFIYNKQISQTKLIAKYIYQGLYYIKHFQPLNFLSYYWAIISSIKLLKKIK